jgi:hypothetical protein
MSATITPAQTASLLHGAPVGGPDGQVVCDSCNEGLTENGDEPTTHVEEVVVYATSMARDRNRWLLRWLACPDCGSVGNGEPTTSTETHATATLAYDPTLECFVLDEINPMTEDQQ